MCGPSDLGLKLHRPRRWSQRKQVAGSSTRANEINRDRPTEGLVVTTTALTPLVQEHLQIAQESTSGRSAQTLFGGKKHVLRQTLIAITGGRALDDHESPGDATLQVLQGRVRLVDDTQSHDGAAGDIMVIPAGRHRLEALEDSAVLLTVARAQ